MADEIVRLLDGHDRSGQGDRRGPRRTAGGHRHPVPFARESPRVRGRARTPRRADLRLQGLGFFEADEIQDAVAVLRYLADPTSNLRAAAFLRSRLVRLSDEAIMRLAPHLADAIVDPSRRAGDRGRRWRGRSDGVAKAREPCGGGCALGRSDDAGGAARPVLAETAYGIEIRGPRRLQARENLKKLARSDPPDSESRIRHAGADRRSLRASGGR